MTKEEKIKEAWGSLFDKLSIRAKECILNNNGQISLYVLNKHDKHILRLGRNKYESDFECTRVDKDAELMFRPKSLQGIENNNGWIKIESEDDLPKEDMHCFIMFNDLSYSIDLFYKEGGFLRNNWKHILYYQPIEKPKPPIY